MKSKLKVNYNDSVIKKSRHRIQVCKRATIPNYFSTFVCVII